MQKKDWKRNLNIFGKIRVSPIFCSYIMFKTRALLMLPISLDVCHERNTSKGKYIQLPVWAWGTQRNLLYIFLGSLGGVAPPPFLASWRHNNLFKQATNFTAK